MNTGMKIGAAVVGGYVLGRRRKAKLAIGLGTWLVGKKLNIDPKKLVTDLGHELRSSPQLQELRNQLRTELLDATKGAAGGLLASQTNRLADSLHSRTEQLRNPAKAADSVLSSGEDEDESADEARSSESEDETSESPSSEAEDDESAGAPKKARSAGRTSASREGSSSTKSTGRTNQKSDTTSRQSQQSSRSTTGRAPSAKSTASGRGASKDRPAGEGTSRSSRGSSHG